MGAELTLRSGEAGDNIAQSEVDEVNTALYDAVVQNKNGTGPASLGGVTDVLQKVPGTGDLIQEAQHLQRDSDAQSNYNMSRGADASDSQNPYGSGRASNTSFQAPPGSVGGPPGPGIPGMNPNMDPQAVIKKIYPILVFR
jgi:hypothetical protein